MVRYLQPDGTPFSYLLSGELLSLSAGDFFKCAHCRRFQRFEGRIFVISQLADTVQLCCEPCRLNGVSCHLWLPDIRKIG
ncbi:MAG TPA: hypothetical protein V6D23_07715 [Candidatus Obscuribacterales bacterium]